MNPCRAAEREELPGRSAHCALSVLHPGTELAREAGRVAEGTGGEARTQDRAPGRGELTSRCRERTCILW